MLQFLLLIHSLHLQTIKNDEKLNQIQISTVDGYQGKQNDVIILSLVRNNSDGNVGFLETDNRVCVALSRARQVYSNILIVLLQNNIVKIDLQTRPLHDWKYGNFEVVFRNMVTN